MKFDDKRKLSFASGQLRQLKGMRIEGPYIIVPEKNGMDLQQAAKNADHALAGHSDPVTTKKPGFWSGLFGSKQESDSLEQEEVD